MRRKPFERIRGTGAITKLPLLIATPSIEGVDEGLLMCPYTNYIPLSYVMLAENHDDLNRSNLLHFHKITKKREKLWSGPTAGFIEKAFTIRYVEEGKNTIDVGMVKTMMPLISQYLFFDRCLSPFTQRNRNRYYRGDRQDIIDSFQSRISTFYQRSYGGFVSPFSLYRYISNSEYIPHVVAAIRPEHYLQIKLKFLLTGKIDMDKIVILIDNQLDTTLFPSPGFKALYKAVKPQILETNAQIYRVPLEFIQENCFLPKFELKEQNIVKRKQEIDRLIEEFYENEKTTTPLTDEEGWAITSGGDNVFIGYSAGATISSTWQYTIPTTGTLHTELTEGGLYIEQDGNDARALTESDGILSFDDDENWEEEREPVVAQERDFNAQENLPF